MQVGVAGRVGEPDAVVVGYRAVSHAVEPAESRAVNGANARGHRTPHAFAGGTPLDRAYEPRLVCMPGQRHGWPDRRGVADSDDPAQTLTYSLAAGTSGAVPTGAVSTPSTPPT